MIYMHNLQITIPKLYIREHLSDEADGHFYLWDGGLASRQLSACVPSVDMTVTHQLPALTQVNRR